MNIKDLSQRSAADIRQMIRTKEFQGQTSGLAPLNAQANLAILPKDDAFDFLLFCQRNPKSCPILDVTEIGSPVPALSAKGADIRTDIPKYHVYKEGEFVEELDDITAYWQDDFVGFLIGCSFSFEGMLLENDIEIRHITDQHNVPMYKTNIPTVSAGKFSGPLVVSMRPMTPADAIRAVQVTTRMPRVHGAPVHLGSPEAIGIDDIHQPDFGDASRIEEGEIPVFWACGVTPQAVAMHSKPDIMITHAPGHMFITDIKNESLTTL